MKLFEAKQILKKNGYRLVEDKYTDIDTVANSETEKIITVDHIDKNNYKDYIGKTVNVKGNVDLSNLGLTKLPIRFIKVDGNFVCSFNKLTTLEGAPSEVGGNFWCSFNKLTNLKGAPEIVVGNFNCRANKLTSLKGTQREIGGDFDCSFNKVQFTEDEVRNYCNVEGDIEV